MEDHGRAGETADPSRDSGMVADERLLPFIELCLNLNHDINNPLTGIIAYAEFIRDDPDLPEEKRRDYIDEIIACAERIQESMGKLGSEKTRLSEEHGLKF